jgi:hypothetical protein
VSPFFLSIPSSSLFSKMIQTSSSANSSRFFSSFKSSVSPSSSWRMVSLRNKAVYGFRIQDLHEFCRCQTHSQPGTGPWLRPSHLQQLTRYLQSTQACERVSLAPDILTRVRRVPTVVEETLSVILCLPGISKKPECCCLGVFIQKFSLDLGNQKCAGRVLPQTSLWTCHGDSFSANCHTRTLGMLDFESG